MRLGLTRREALIYGGASLLSGVLGKEKLLEGAQDAQRRKFKRLIYLWGDGGGPSLPDFNDPKEESNPHVDTIYPTVQTTVPGLRLTEPFQALAPVMHHIVSFRARMASDLDHSTAIAEALRRQEDSGEHLLSKVASMNSGMPFVYAEPPGVIRFSDYRREAFSVQLGSEAHWSWEERRYIPPSLGDPHPHHESRRELRKKLEALGQHRFESTKTAKMEGYMEMAHRLITLGKETIAAPSEEDVHRYSNGKRPTPGTLLPLLARDLIRREVASVVIVRTGYHGGYGSFDHHDNLPSRMSRAAPQFAHSVTELIRDYLAGMLPDTILVFDTEFGRERKMNYDAGRHHFRFHPAFVLGEAYESGSVIGSTDNQGMGKEDLVDDAAFEHIIWEGVRNEPDFAARSRLPRGIFRRVS